VATPCPACGAATLQLHGSAHCRACNGYSPLYADQHPPTKWPCRTCAGEPPPPDAKTVREWDTLYAARVNVPLRVRAGDWLAGLIQCPACLRLRISPAHWWTCR
jgi:hypothetical protein